MIEIENPTFPSPGQWRSVVDGVRNPYASWDKSDSAYYLDGFNVRFNMGEKDLALMSKLSQAGDDHGKFMRMLPVIVTITGPFYWWKEMDQYKIGTVTDSCSTMHNLMDKEFELEDFSPSEYQYLYPIPTLNALRSKFLEESDPEEKKAIWQAVVTLLPCGYLQKRTWSGNYQVLKHIYHARKDHKLQEWRELCEWIKDEVPFAKELIVGNDQ